MERWLRHQLASRLRGSICTNAVFPFPQQVMEQALARLEGGGDDVPPDPWSNNALTWALLEVLPELLTAPDSQGALLPLRRYLLLGQKEGAKLDEPVAPRALALAGQLADVFDRLVVFRPEFAIQWSRGKVQLPRGAEHLTWLPLLWRAAQRHVEQGTDDGAHRAERWARLMGSAEPALWPFDQPLRIFGIASLPPSVMRQLAWLSQAGQVELYLVCPSDARWADLHELDREAVGQLLEHDRDRLSERMNELRPERINPLVQSMGRVARDMQLLLEGVDEEVVDETAPDSFVDPAPHLAGDGKGASDALHVLQSDLLASRDPLSFGEDERAARPLRHGDDSLQFHACYGPTRQVEVLHEALLHLFEDHPDRRYIRLDQDGMPTRR